MMFLDIFFLFIIEHINLLCFVLNTSTIKFNVLSRYVYNRAINLFSMDIITDNFCVLATHACKINITEKPK